MAQPSDLFDQVMRKDLRVALFVPPLKERPLLIKAFHDKGFTDVKIQRDLISFLKNPDKDHFDIAILYAETEADYGNIDFFLQSLYEKPTHLRVGVIYGRNAAPIVQRLFAQGILFAWQDIKGLSSTSIQRLVNDFVQVCEPRPNRTEIDVAATYLRHFLKVHMMYSSLVVLEQAVSAQFPDKLDYTVRLAEAYFLEGDYRAGRNIIDQARSYSIESLDKHIDELMAKYPQAALKKGPSLASRLGFTNVFVKESDSQEMKSIEKIMERLGITNIRFFDSYVDLLKELEIGPEPDLILCDYSRRSQDISAVQFIQRLRGVGIRAPLILVAGDLPAQDGQLIADMHVQQILTRPLRIENSVLAVAYALQQAKNPSERKSIEDKLLISLERGEFTYARHLRKKHFSHPEVPVSRKCYIDGLIFYYEGTYDKAKEVLLKALQQSKIEDQQTGKVKPNIDKITILAKVLHKLKETPLAIQLLENAQKKSPFNISLHLTLIEMKEETGDFVSAKADLELARQIDSGNMQVVGAGLRLSLLSNDIALAKELLAAPNFDKESFITRTNNEAILMIQRGEPISALTLYQNALKVLSNKDNQLRAAVNYNLSLAYLRSDGLEEGISALESAIGEGETKVSKKASSLLMRAEKALNDGVPLVLRTPASPSFTEKDLLSSLNARRPARREPKICLQDIFVVNGKSNATKESAQQSALEA